LINKLVAQGVSFDKVSLQIYLDKDSIEAYGGIDPFVVEAKKAFDSFTAKTGYPLFIAEFGFTSADQQYRVDFIREFVTMAKDSPNIEGFIFYHWMDELWPDNALVLVDGTLTLAGEEFKKIKDK